MIDETCEAQMPKILNLLNRLSKDLPRSYQKYADVSESFSHLLKSFNCHISGI
jgi:hypothetical protein